MKPTTFAFGTNWQSFLQENYRNELVLESASYLAKFLGVENLEGKTFVDIGAGSGLHSEAALSLGAARVVSVDLDPDAIRCVEMLRANNMHGKRCEIIQGSILDKEFIGGLGQFDVVYCWGVAHHTGAMWEALGNLVSLMNDHSKLYIAIYNRVPGNCGSTMWYRIKKTYAHAPVIVKRLMEGVYISISFIELLIHFKNPFAVIHRYYKKRGMSWKRDLIDWLGGYPYEYTSTEELFHFFKTNYGMKLEHLRTTNYIGCNQLLLSKE